MAVDKVEFDILAHDRASDKLDKIARSFRNVGDEAGDVDRNTNGIDRLTNKFRQAGDDSGKGFGSRLKRWFSGEGGGLFHEVGKSGGTVFGSGLLGALKTPILGPALIAIVGGVVATVMPAIGAVAGGALVAGFGAGLAGLGIAFAAKSEAVQKKWSSTMGQLGADMRLLSRPFESTLINIASYFQRTVDKFNPALGKAFSTLAPVVDRFVNRASRSLEQLIPAIGPISDAFGAVLDSLGPALDSAIGNLASGMTRLAQSIQKNPEGLADLVTGLGAVVGQALNLITILNNVNGSFTTLTGGVSLVDVTMSLLIGPLATISAMFAGLGKVIDLVNAAVGRTGKDTANAGASMSAAATQTAALAQGLDRTGAAAHGVAAPVKTAADRVRDAKQAAAEAKQKFEDFITSLFRLQNMALTLSGAQIGLQAAMDAASAAVKANGRATDINTEKGRANKLALDGWARATNVQSEAMIRSDKSTSRAGLAAQKSTAGFVRLAMQMGYTRPQAQAMARELIKIPNVTREARLKADKKDLDAKLAAAKRALANPNLTATKRAKLEARYEQLKAAVAAAQARINSLRGKTVYTNLIYTSVFRGGRLGQDPEGKAVGGPVKKGTPYIVGEKRPELFVPDQDGTILPHVPSRSKGSALGGSSGSAGVTVNLEVASTGGRMEDMFAEMIRHFVRVNGGNVQEVLGQ